MRLAAILVLVVAGCGDDGVTYPDAAPAADANLAIDAAPARETIMSTTPLEPGESVEGIMTGDPDDVALIHLMAPNMKMAWNIHSHPGGAAVNVYEEYNKQTVDYRFVPPAQGDWYLLVRNDHNVEADFQIEVRLYGDMTWRWQ